MYRSVVRRQSTTNAQFSDSSDKKKNESGARNKNWRSPSRFRSPPRAVYTQRKSSRTNMDFINVFIILGATSYVARKKGYPTLWNLYKNDLLPPNTKIYAFAKHNTTMEEFRNHCENDFHVKQTDKEKFEEFWDLNNFNIGSYTSKVDFDLLSKDLNDFATVHKCINRLFYFALPIQYLEVIIQNFKSLTQRNNHGGFSKGWVRVIVEKPFGHDKESFHKMAQILLTMFKEEEIYRIDHYLGKEMIQNLSAIRFSNLLFSSTWNRNFIQSILITVKDPSGVRHQCKYFDNHGIIREVMQNHLLQILSLIAMEKPASTKAEDVRDEKVKVLKSIAPLKLEDCVLGQYVGNPKAFEGSEATYSYTDETDIPNNSLTPTFCTTVLKIHNERWDGVPFILKCGKAMDEKLIEVRIQYKDIPADIFENKPKRNELIIQIGPNAGVYIRATTKVPNILSDKMEGTELTLFKNKHKISQDVFERLILEVFRGSQSNFIRYDELIQAWRIFSSLLQKIDDGKIQPSLYINGTDGPKEADELIRKNKFVFYD